MVNSPTIDVQTEATLLEQVAILGRKAELRQFIKALTLCRTGQGKAIFLSGNEGIGKTSLLNTFLGLAQDAYGCRAISIVLPQQASPPLVFAQLVEEILGLSNQILAKTLVEANQILKPLGLHWAQGDLVRIIALMRLQESMGSSQGFAEEQLSQSIYEAIPFFKRMSGSVRTQIQQLSSLLFNPWLTLAVSLINPINPQVQNAISLVKQILGKQHTELRLQSTNPYGIPLLTGSPVTPEPPADPDALEIMATSIQSNGHESIPEDAETLLEVPEETESGMPTLAKLQTALKDLLIFINNGLRNQQSALILSFDQWEMLENTPEGIRKDMNELFSDVVRSAIDQRDTRLMLIISCRSEAESYAIGGSLYNILKVKYLVPPLAATAQQRLIKEHFKAAERQCDDPVIQELQRLCKGNPAWLLVMTTVIENDMAHSGLPFLDWDTYQERYAVSQPADMLEYLYTRFQLAFVGEEAVFLKTLGKLTGLYSHQSFRKNQVASLIPAADAGMDFVDRLLDGLVQYGFLARQTDAEGREPSYHFYSPFLPNYLRSKSRPLQEDIPAPDKVSSLRKVLPLSIQSGELTREKTKELLAMASALDNPELVQYVEETLISVLDQPDVTDTTRIAILESLALLLTAPAIQAMVAMLKSPEAALREAASLQLIPLANRTGVSVPKKTLVEAMVPLTQDPVKAVQYQAYQFLALCLSEGAVVLPILLEGARHDDTTIRFLSVTGLVQHRINRPEVLSLYQSILQENADPLLIKAAIRGLNYFDKEAVTPVLVAFLETHPQNSTVWQEVLVLLMNLNLGKALPWITTLLTDSQDNDLKLFVLKKMGSRPNPDVEKILIQVLNPQNTLVPEVRWMAIRSLGWIGHSQESLRVLEEQHPLCQNDEILGHALKSALAQVSDRVSPLGISKSTTNGDAHEAKVYVPIQRVNADALQLNGHDADEDEFIDLVVAASDN